MSVTSDVGPWSIVPEWVLDADISDRAVRLYGLLGRYADSNGTSFPLRRTLYQRLRCSESSLDRAAKELISVGALHVEQRTDADGINQSNLWTLFRVSPEKRGGVTHAATPGVTSEEQNESHKELETSSAPSARNGHPPRRSKADLNAIWDTLTDIFGPVTTRTNEQLRGRVVQSLAAAGATPDEIIRRAKAWPAHFDSATLTAPALEKHWDTLNQKPLRRR